MLERFAKPIVRGNCIWFESNALLKNKNEVFMLARIILRLLIVFTLILNIFIMIFSFLLNENTYKKYGKQILKGIALFIFFVLVLYTTFAIIGFTY